MVKFRFWQAAEDYLKTRKRLWVKLIVPTIVTTLYAIPMILFCVNDGIEITEVFSDFVNVQIGAVTILISFSIAIMTILVTADNENIKKIKEIVSEECRPINGTPLNMFQVLLSNIAYKIIVEVAYLSLLIIFVLVQLFATESALKILVGASIFFLTHILHILLESIGKMYLTFWKKIS